MPLLLKIAVTKPPEASIKKELCNDLSPEKTNMVIKNFTAESKRLYTDRSKSSIPNNPSL